MSFETKVSPDYAQASFASEEEIKKNCISIDLTKFPTGEGGGIPVVTDGNVMMTLDGDSSTVTVASTGSGKTTRAIIPHAISCANAGVSMVIHDPKADIYKHLKPMLDKAGYKTIVLNYRNPEYGDRFNPYEPAAKLYKEGHTDTAREMNSNFSDTIFSRYKSDKDPFWHLTSAGYNTGLAELCCQLMPPENVTFDAIFDLHLQGSESFSGSTYMKSYFSKKSDERCWKLIYPVATAPNETRNSLNAVFSGALSTFVQNDAIVDQTSNSTFEIEDLINEKVALFIIARDENSAYDPLITATIDLIYSVLVTRAEENGGILNRRVTFLLDEFGNLPALRDIEKKLTLSRARGISWHLVCQSLDQLSLIYGKERAPIIIGNCNNLIYMYSPDIALVKHISALCGERKGEQISDIKSPLCPVDMLRHLDKYSGETLLLLERQKPFITHLPYITNYYGVEKLDKVDFKKREPQKLERFDFQAVVKEMKKKELEMMMHDDELEHKKKRQRYSEEKRKRKEADPCSAISIVNNVIFEILGGDC